MPANQNCPRFNAKNFKTREALSSQKKWENKLKVIICERAITRQHTDCLSQDKSKRSWAGLKPPYRICNEMDRGLLTPRFGASKKAVVITACSIGHLDLRDQNIHPNRTSIRESVLLTLGSISWYDGWFLLKISSIHQHMHRQSSIQSSLEGLQLRLPLSSKAFTQPMSETV